MSCISVKELISKLSLLNPDAVIAIYSKLEEGGGLLQKVTLVKPTEDEPYYANWYPIRDINKGLENIDLVYLIGE